MKTPNMHCKWEFFLLPKLAENAIFETMLR